MKTIILIAVVTGISVMSSSCAKEKDGVAPPPTPPKFYIEKKDESKLFLEP